MKNQSKIMAKLMGMAGAIQERKNIHDYVIRSPSPSLNFVFGNAHGLPAGFSVQLYGPPKGGKSLLCYAMIGQLHRDDPDAWAVKFDTEYRDAGQLSEEDAKMWGIDLNRYVVFQTNRPDEIFDRIEKDFPALAQDLGMKLKLVIIDSLTNIQGRRAMNADTVMTQQIGDNALTNQEGMRRILPVQRSMGFGLIITAQVRAQMDQLEIHRGNKYRPATSFGTQHHCEYNLWVEPNRNKDGKADLNGKSFYDETVEDVAGKGEKTAHRIRVKMVDSSLGPKERSGEFTFDYTHGVVNQHEETFTLGTGYGIITKPNAVMYQFGGKEWRGKPAMLEALRSDPVLCEEILTELRRRDLANQLVGVPVKVEESPEAA